MCGINVTFGFSADEHQIQAMNHGLVHRGPDAEGTYLSEHHPLGLGSRRLKIIDLESGDMPYRSPCGRYAMVFNGEIYNFEGLRPLCGDYAFASRCDGEVLFALLQREGLRALQRVNGMFSLAFWDEEEGALTVARDRLGIKPLFFANRGGHWAFSSELKPLRELPWVSDELDGQAIGHYMSLLCFTEPSTVFRDIRRFPSATALTIQGSSLKWERIWSLDFSKTPLEEGEWREGLLERFERSLKYRRVSDVPLGLFLSGGLDSNILASATQRVLGEPLQCHSMSFEGGGDETEMAQKTADALGHPFYRHHLQAKDLLESLPKVLDHFGEPFAGGWPLYFLCKEACSDLTVALTGTGGDELFGNYGRVKDLRPGLGWRRGVASLFKREGWPEGGMEGLKHTLSQGACPGYFHQEKVLAMKGALKAQLLGANPRTDRLLDERYWHQADLELEDRLFAVEMQTQLRSEFLFSQDILSMAHSMELRVPFLDHELVEWVAKAPPAWRSQPENPKGIMAEVFAKDLPPAVKGMAKQGFMVPYGRWLREDLRPIAEVLFGRENLNRRGVIRHEPLQQVWQDHLRGSRRDYELWPVFVYLLFEARLDAVDLGLP